MSKEIEKRNEAKAKVILAENNHNKCGNVDSRSSLMDAKALYEIEMLATETEISIEAKRISGKIKHHSQQIEGYMIKLQQLYS